MAATLTTARVFDGFRGAPERAFWHGHSFCGNPLGAAVAREVLAVFRDEEVLARAVPKARRIADAFQALAAIPGAHAPRALGMVGAIDLAADAGYLGERGWRAYAEARRLGAYLRPMGDVVYIAPPLNIDDADLDELLDIVRRSVIHALG
jgi:adenosylmethionine---8-amino-7-oxononanoate aminotransferase